MCLLNTLYRMHFHLGYHGASITMTHAHAHTQTHMHARTHTYTHTRAHAHTQIHTHTHVLEESMCATIHVFGSQGQFCGVSHLLPSLCGLQGMEHVTRVPCKCIYQLSHLLLWTQFLIHSTSSLLENHYSKLQYLSKLDHMSSK